MLKKPVLVPSSLQTTVGRTSLRVAPIYVARERFFVKSVKESAEVAPPKKGERDNPAKRRFRARIEIIDQVRMPGDEENSVKSSTNVGVLPVDAEADARILQAVRDKLNAEQAAESSAANVDTDEMQVDKDNALKRKNNASDGSESESDAESVYSVKVRNRFTLLDQVTRQECEAACSTSNAQQASTKAATTPKEPRAKKQPAPPPLKLHDDHNHKRLVALINPIVKAKFTIKHTREGVIINTETREDRLALVDKFKEKSFNFHSYTDKLVKTNSFVIRGLHRTVTPDEIMTSLKTQHQISAVRCTKLRTTKAALFMVAVSQDITLQKLKSIADIDHATITWERYSTKKRITQCRNCQLWGHAEANCYAVPRCAKCTKNHLTSACTEEEGVAPVCVNCNGKHRANSIECPSFEQRKAWLDRKSAARQPADSREARRAPPPRLSAENFPPLRTFAPAPTTNPWARVNNAEQAVQRQVPTRQQASTSQPTAPSSATNSEALGAYQELRNQMRELNSLININEVINQIKHLNSLLQKAGSKGERMQIAIQFFAGLDG